MKILLDTLFLEVVWFNTSEWHVPRYVSPRMLRFDLGRLCVSVMW